MCPELAFNPFHVLFFVVVRRADQTAGAVQVRTLRAVAQRVTAVAV